MQRKARSAVMSKDSGAFCRGLGVADLPDLVADQIVDDRTRPGEPTESPAAVSSRSHAVVRRDTARRWRSSILCPGERPGRRVAGEEFEH